MQTFPQEEIDGEGVGFDIIFTIIVILAASFSAYTTYLGFSYDLPLLASGVIATIIGLGLFMINMKIKEYRKNGQSLVSPLLAFLFFLIFSFISNTNAIYTYFLQKDIVPQTQIIAEKDFDKGTSMILAAIDNNEITTKAALVKKELDIATRNLYDQMIDPANPGLGPKAREHLGEVERVLGFGITELKPPRAGSSMKQYTAFADNLIALIDKQFKTKYMVGTTENLEVFKKDIQQTRTIYKTSIINKEYDRDITDAMARDLASLQIKAEHIINFKEKVPVINTSADDIGSFNYTWTNFVNGINKSAISLSVLLSLMLDTLAPVLAILLYRRKEIY